MDTNYLVDQLRALNVKYNVVGVKQSFEDEGVLVSDVITMRRLTDIAGMQLSIKIGGCEALSDIHNCVRIGSDKIVAPMIETEFALQKFIESVADIKNIKFYINIESRMAIEQLDKILESPSSKLLSGIVIGRSDLTKSYGLSKSNTDSKEIYNIIYQALQKIKSYNITTLMGGNLSLKSIEFIQLLHSQQLLDYIETRNLILKLTNDNVHILDNAVEELLIFESNWLKYKSEYYNKLASTYMTRSLSLMDRL